MPSVNCPPSRTPSSRRNAGTPKTARRPCKRRVAMIPQLTVNRSASAGTEGSDWSASDGAAGAGRYLRRRRRSSPRFGGCPVRAGRRRAGERTRDGGGKPTGSDAERDPGPDAGDSAGRCLGPWGQRAQRQRPGFVWLGTMHMLARWDHLLFVGGILLLARRAAKLISLFALGHSITRLPPWSPTGRSTRCSSTSSWRLSLVFVGVVGLPGRPKDWAWFAAAVLAFGLAHGLGLSTRLQAIGLPSDGMIPRVLAFNIGVEIRQLIAVVGRFMLGDVLSHYIPPLRNPRLSHKALVAAGCSPPRYSR
ncbi:HupE/UreJ family protein [Micromonospora sp. SL1-18]|uniref:HupE/UreJ family protein n=1 Tax=Micromonospora sp. SL1-18 TaxID=3399128 RepID=UPI003A4E2F6D